MSDIEIEAEEPQQWSDEVEQTAEMPAVKLFGRWTTEDVQVCFVWTSPNRRSLRPIK